MKNQPAPAQEARCVEDFLLPRSNIERRLGKSKQKSQATHRVACGGGTNHTKCRCLYTIRNLGILSITTKEEFAPNIHRHKILVSIFVFI
jgi:hypothetical protein